MIILSTMLGLSVAGNVMFTALWFYVAINPHVFIKMFGKGDADGNS
ncbi:MAG: hypothetical protein AAF267_20175 [Deinococcota bacterium]